MFQTKKTYLNLGLVLIIVLTSAATWFLCEFIVFGLDKIGDDYDKVSLEIVGELAPLDSGYLAGFRPKAKAQAGNVYYISESIGNNPPAGQGTFAKPRWSDE